MTRHNEKTESDAQLMAKVINGERAPLGELYLRYGQMLHCAVSRWLPACSTADAEDLVQEIFMKLADFAKNYKETGQFKAWLFAVAYRQSMYLGRAKRNHGKKMETNMQAIISSVGPIRPESHDVRIEMRGAIAKIMEQLPAELREVLILKSVEGFTSVEISKITGIAESTARTRIHRARELVLLNLDIMKRKEFLQSGAV